MTMTGRRRRLWSGTRRTGLDHLGDTDASTFKHGQPDAGDDRRSEVTEKWMKPDHGLPARIKPLSRSGFERQRRVVPLVMALWRQCPVRSVAGGDGALATALLMGQQSQARPDVSVLSLVGHPSFMLIPDHHGQDRRLRATSHAGGLDASAQHFLIWRCCGGRLSVVVGW
jgi:hypothetical protein